MKNLKHKNLCYPQDDNDTISIKCVARGYYDEIDVEGILW